MGKIVLIDSGPLVAVLRRRDQHHEWARAHFAAATEPFLTCEAVLSESFFLLERAREGKEALCALLEREIVKVEFSFATRSLEIVRLLRRYDDTPMSFADACLVQISDDLKGATVFTTDSDFRTYRRSNRQVIPTIMPE
jgi:predicted nucleic acid-binding protein